MRKVFQFSVLFMLWLGSGTAFLPAAAQRQSATVSARVIANNLSEGWNVAAHHSLPLGTVLHTVNAANNRKVVLKVGRKLPKNLPHAMEISQAAADSLGLGSAEATLRIEYSPAALPRSGQVVANAYREVSAINDQSAKRTRVYYDNEEIPAETVETPPAAEETKPVTNSKPAAASNTKNNSNNKKDNKTDKVQPFAANGTYNTRGTKVAVKGFGLQLHAFNESAKAVKEAFLLEKKKLGKVYIQVVMSGRKGSYRVIMGEYPTKNAAEKAAKTLKAKHQLKTIVKQHL